MKIVLAILFFTVLSFNLFAQNLVNNPSFENYNQCPQDIGMGFSSYITYADNWDFSAPSPDFFHTCGGTNASIPQNYFGYQVAASGSGYAGFSAYQKYSNLVNAREGIISKLNSTLEIGQTYYCTFKVSLANNSVWACNNLGMYFTTKFHQIPFSTKTQFSQVNKSQIYEPSIISDSINWTIISGSFVADSNYLYVSITNHFDDINTKVSSINPNILFGTAYYYIDDICISKNPNDCGFISTEIISTKENLIPYISPNPTSEIVIIDLKNIIKEGSVEFYSISGKLKKRIEFANSNLVKIDLNMLPQGIYIVKIETDSNSYNSKLIIN